MSYGPMAGKLRLRYKPKPSTTIYFNIDKNGNQTTSRETKLVRYLRETDEDRHNREIEKTKEYKLLNDMVDCLGSAGVDVSYFPAKAREILREYAQLITINK